MAKLTYRSLTAEAGVTQGSLRHHFPHLNAVLEAALEWCLEVSLGYKEPSGSLVDTLRHMDGMMREHPELPRFLTEVYVAARHAPELLELVKRHQEIYRERARASFVEAGLEVDEELVEIIVAMGDGMVFQRVVFGAEHEPVTERQIAGSRRLLSCILSEASVRPA
ncbi:TetR family transcriptional regulator [Arthrobacter ginkgonis]|uniref:TetR family transcriptional regulator n=2 Tax=Arthrobacter ginkgonis TaxID=1630594 RepID=A0ABP7C516_9MICC